MTKCLCPTCHTQMTEEYGPLAPGGPSGRSWRCDNDACPDKGLERMWPDAPDAPDAPATPLRAAVTSVANVFGETAAACLEALELEVSAVEVLIPEDERRWGVLAAIAAMPDEAFGYILRPALVDFPQLAKNHGFRPESCKSFEEVAAAAEAYMKSQP